MMGMAPIQASMILNPQEDPEPTMGTHVQGCREMAEPGVQPGPLSLLASPPWTLIVRT